MFASALPVAYATGTGSTDWVPFASAVLDALYDATFAAAAVLAREQNARKLLYLTAVGGGAFGNRTEWIAQAITKAIEKYQKEPLDVKLVHHGSLPRRGALSTLLPVGRSG